MGLEEDFKKYCAAIQPKLNRIIITFIFSFGFLTYNEVAFYQGSDSLQIVGCGIYSDQNSWASNYGNVTTSNCFKVNITQCLASQYNTDISNTETLKFNVPFSGISSDSAGKTIGGLVIISYLLLQLALQVFTHVAMLKRNRVQDLLGRTSVYIISSKLGELKKPVGIFLTAVFYIGMKVAWTLNRENYYARLDCQGIKLHLDFTLNEGQWMPGIIQSAVIFFLIALQHLSTLINLLSDMDLRNLLIHFKQSSFTQLDDITILPIDTFNRLISKKVDNNYLHLSKIPRLIKKCVFVFPMFSITNDEIAKYILDFKSQNPSAFYPHNVLLSDIGKNGAGDSESLIN